MKSERFRDTFAIDLDGDWLIDSSLGLDQGIHARGHDAASPHGRGKSYDVLSDISEDGGRDLGWLGYSNADADDEEAQEAPGIHGRGRTSDDDATSGPQNGPKWKDDSASAKPGKGNGRGKDKDSDADSGDTTDSDGTTGGGDTTDSGDTTGGDGTTDGGGTTGDSDAASTPAPQYAIDALQSGYSWGSGPVEIAFSFLQQLPGYYSSSDPEASDFSSFTAAQQTATYSVLNQISELVNVSFVETAASDAQMTFANTSLGSGIGAWAYYPYSASTSAKAADVWVNSDYSSQLSPSVGNFAYLTLLHEVGHAMGLKHPHEGSSSLSGIENTRQYTVESYNKHPSMGGVDPQSYMTYDIAALQDLYGANMSTRAGDDVYDFGHAVDLIETIWDSGGLDTFDASGQGGAVYLDLNAGAFSSIGTLGNGWSASDNVAIAYNVTIESALGGSGDDTIVGNAAANNLGGGSGSDTLVGGGGADHFMFGAGWGTDTITDFEDGLDLFDFSSLSVTMADLTIGDTAEGVSIGYGDDSVVVSGISSLRLDAGDFLFA